MNDPNHEPTHAIETPAATEGASKGKRRATDRLNIPSGVVRASGFAPGDNAYVMNHDAAAAAEKPLLVLLKDKPEIPLGEYVVSKDCRIRVTPAMLKKCGLAGDTFEFDGREGKIVVRPRKAIATPGL